MGAAFSSEQSAWFVSTFVSAIVGTDAESVSVDRSSQNAAFMSQNPKKPTTEE
jgi:hypothetical protein